MKNDTTPTPIDGPLDDSIEAQAEYWLTRLDAEPDNPELQQAFNVWYEQSPAHAEAFANAELLWQTLGDLKPAVVSIEQPSRRRRWPTLVASVLLCTGLALWQWQQFQSDLMQPQGPPATVQLEDGSRLVADSNSRIDLDFDHQQRLLTLKAGRLYIDVTHDARPLTVAVGALTVTALGTEFTVQRLGDDIQISVQQSKVLVSEGPLRQTLNAGQQLWITDGQWQSVAPLGSDRGLRWQEGWLVARDQPLRRVVAELNRYHPDHLLLLDSALAERKINTVLNVRTPEQALTALLSSLRLSQQSLGPVRLITASP